MKAIVYSRYGPPDVLRCVDVARPEPSEQQVLIRVRAASINPYDRHFMRGRPYPIRLMTGLRRPTRQTLGVDVAGHVEAVGRHVREFKPGDEVFGGCRGSFAEYACASQGGVVKKPEGITFEEAAAANIAGLTALQAVRDCGRIQADQQVLVNGAAGGVGTFAVQLAKSFGADVTGVCSTTSQELVRSIGANRTIDYTREDFTRDTRRYDQILDVIGNHAPSACRRVLEPEGVHVIIGASSSRSLVAAMASALVAVVWSRFVRRRTVLAMAKASQGDLAALGALMQSGRIKTVIDRRYSLADVPAAIRYLEEGHAHGKIVITMG